MEKISPAEFSTYGKLPLLDVRTPLEFERGHIPGAINFPIFSNEERVIVGTLYKKEGKDAAVQKGLEMVGPKLADFAKEAKLIAQDKELILHCWRGGMRSSSMAWLLETAGLRTKVLEGGYKAYRQHIHLFFSKKPLQLKILSGKTGSGKTIVLHALRKKGFQIIDLEGLANHKGSAFGSIGENPQPKTEHFENLLHFSLMQFDLDKPIWVENESRGIGSVYIPEGFWTQMAQSPIFNISIPDLDRLTILTKIYVNEKPQLLEEAFHRIQRKIGGKNYKIALEALHQKDYHHAARIALLYYDKTYNYSLQGKSERQVAQFDFDKFDVDKIVERLTK